jgi:hypothetical protein
MSQRSKIAREVSLGRLPAEALEVNGLTVDQARERFNSGVTVVDAPTEEPVVAEVIDVTGEPVVETPVVVEAPVEPASA